MSESRIPDRIYVDLGDLAIIEKLKSENYFNFKNKSRKEQFMFAFSVGVRNEMDLTQIQKRQELFFVKDFKNEDLALLKACAIHKTKNIESIENITDIYHIAEEYAHSGFLLLEGMMNSSSLNSLEKLYEADITRVFNEIVF